MNKNYLSRLVKKKNETKLFLKANEARKEQVGERVTYVVNRNINFTNRCEINCKFCTFNQKKDKKISISKVLDKIENGIKKYDISEVCLQGGIDPKLKKDFYLKLLKEIDQRFDIHIHAFSPQEIIHMSNGSVKKTLKELRENGLDSMPGTAAEILVDDVREKICPNKLSSGEWIRVLEKAHNLGIKSTGTMMYGHVEGWEDRINHLLKIRKLQKKTNGFTEIIPLPLINQDGKKKTNLLTDFKVISLARIILGDLIKNVQASWVKLGVSGALEALYFGANDLGGTLIEENITEKNERKKIVSEEMRYLIKKAEKIPKERTTLYEEV